MMGRITIKNAADIEKMKAAGNIVKEALDLLSEKAAIGMTTDGPWRKACAGHGDCDRTHD